MSWSRRLAAKPGGQKYLFAGKEKVLPKVQGGVDPAEERRDAKLALLTAQENSFEAVARAWHKVWAEGNHARYAEDVMNRLERNVFPNVGHKPVSHIEPKDIVRMMERIQGRGRERHCSPGAEYV